MRRDLLNTLISNLNLLLSQDIDDDAVRYSIIAKRLRRYLRPDWIPPEAKIGSGVAISDIVSTRIRPGASASAVSFGNLRKKRRFMTIRAGGLSVSCGAA